MNLDVGMRRIGGLIHQGAMALTPVRTVVLSAETLCPPKSALILVPAGSVSSLSNQVPVTATSSAEP